MTLQDHLAAIGACGDAQNWASLRANATDAWITTDRPDWLLFWAARTAVNDPEEVSRMAEKLRIEVSTNVIKPRPTGKIAAAQFSGCVETDEMVERIWTAAANDHTLAAWENAQHQVNQLWIQTASNAWTVAEGVSVPDWCTWIRSVLRQPWVEK